MDYSEILSRYRRYRQVTWTFNNEVFHEYVQTEEIKEAARQLGLWSEEDKLVLDTYDQICVVMDHAFYGVRIGPKTVVERCLAERRAHAAGNEAAVLEAMSRMYYSLFGLEETVEGVGVVAHDAFYNRNVFLADTGFSRTMGEGVIIASRVLPFDDFVMTTGAALPVDDDTLDAIDDVLERSHLSPRTFQLAAPEHRDRLTAKIIRTCIECDASFHIAYEDVDATDIPDDVIPMDEVPTKVGRNAPCPCGSGKKYKKCCGR